MQMENQTFREPLFCSVFTSGAAQGKGVRVSHRTHARTMGPKSITRYGVRFGLLLFKVDRRRRAVLRSRRAVCV